LFPFLIGRIKREDFEIVIEEPAEFPFLIGRIKRIKRMFAKGANDEFPFLIGRIKRTELWLLTGQRICVSIPHR